MQQRRTRRLLAAASIIGVMAMGAACTPPGPPILTNVSFGATKVTVNDSQDAVYDPIFGLCVSLTGCSDEPYVLQIGFRVKLGVPGSATTFTTGSRDNELPNSLGAGQSAALTGARQATATFNGIQGLDIGDLSNTDNHLEVFGTYTWAVEKDAIGIGLGLDSTADVLKVALNQTLAQNVNLPSDTSSLVSLIFNNLGSALGIVVNNLPQLGLGDDTLGGAMFIGVGARGALADVIDSTAVAFPPMNLLGDNKIPPKIVGGTIYSLKASRNFTQSFSGAGGTHTYDFAATIADQPPAA